MNGPVQAAEFLVTGENRQVADGRTAWKFFDAKGANIWIDRNGNPVAAPVGNAAPRQPKGFAESRPYSGGFAAVDAGGACGYVDESGLLKPPRFRACGDFRDNLAKVVTLAGNATYISAALTPIHAGMPATEDSPGLWFGDGLAPMQDDAIKLWGYIDARGQWSIAPQFQVAGGFSEGLAPVEELDRHDRPRLGFIDRTGKRVIPHQFGSQSATGHWLQFSEGRAIVADPARFQSTAKMKTGATVEDPRRAWYGVIDTAGRWISPLRFQSCGACVFLDGRAQVFGPGQKLIDIAGRIVWSANNRFVRRTQRPGCAECKRNLPDRRSLGSTPPAMKWTFMATGHFSPELATRDR
jgi:hypothetical protein